MDAPPTAALPQILFDTQNDETARESSKASALLTICRVLESIAGITRMNGSLRWITMQFDSTAQYIIVEINTKTNSRNFMFHSHSLPILRACYRMFSNSLFVHIKLMQHIREVESCYVEGLHMVVGDVHGTYLDLLQLQDEATFNRLWEAFGSIFHQLLVACLVLSCQFFFEFPSGIPHPCTTMPWTIWPALVVLWGVCWMFRPQQDVTDTDVLDQAFWRDSEAGGEGVCCQTCVPDSGCWLITCYFTATWSPFGEWDYNLEPDSFDLSDILDWPTEVDPSPQDAGIVNHLPQSESIASDCLLHPSPPYLGVFPNDIAACTPIPAVPFLPEPAPAETPLHNFALLPLHHVQVSSPALLSASRPSQPTPKWHCSTCDIRFGRKETLNRHIFEQGHSGEPARPSPNEYLCPTSWCKRSAKGNGFRRLDKLGEHLKRKSCKPLRQTSKPRRRQLQLAPGEAGAGGLTPSSWSIGVTSAGSSESPLESSSGHDDGNFQEAAKPSGKGPSLAERVDFAEECLQADREQLRVEKQEILTMEAKIHAMGEELRARKETHRLVSERVATAQANLSMLLEQQQRFVGAYL